MNHPFTWVFLAALALATAARLWLALRQVRHVRAHREAVPESFAASIPLEAHHKAADYTVAKTQLGMVDAVWSAVLLLALTLGGALQWLSDAWARLVAPFGIVHGALLVVSVLMLLSILDLPFAWYRTFVIEERYGFNRMTPRLFVSDLLKQALVSAALGIPLLVAILWLMQKAGNPWWLYAWAVVAAYLAFLQMIYPMFVMPLFNKFSPLQDAALAERVQKLLERCDFRSRGLFVMDGSKRSAHGNAFFAGFGAGKRIVFFDTLLERLDPGQVEAVLAHELGHYKLKHILKGMVLSWLMTFAMFCLLGFLLNERWFYEGLGVQTASTAAALVLFMLVLPVFLFFSQPLMSRFSRKREFEADQYATRHASPRDLVEALAKLYKDNASTLTPDPLHSAFYDSHPPAATRIARLRTA